MNAGPKRVVTPVERSQSERRSKTMKLNNSTIVAIAVAGGFSLTAYVMGQGQGTTSPTNTGQNVQSAQSLQQQAGQGAVQSNPSAKPSTTIGPVDNTKGSAAAKTDAMLQPLDETHPANGAKKVPAEQPRGKKRPTAAPTASP